jgi:8-oxo-dGTP pyrophosphatase MutT (NUDIX family)
VFVAGLILKGDEVLMLRRSPAKNFGAGKWEPVSGGIQPHETPLEALLREVFEETGLSVEVLGEEPFVAWMMPAPDGGEVEGQVFVCRHVDGEVAKSNEHDAVRWVRIAAAADIRGLMPGLDTVLRELAVRFTAAAVE